MHFQVLDNSSLLFPGRRPPFCNTPRPAGRSGLASYEVTALIPGTHETLCACFKNIVCSPSPLELLQSSPTGLKAKCSEGFFSQHLNPRLGDWCGLRILTLWENSYDIIILQFVGCPCRQVWDLIISWVGPSYHLVEFLLYVFGRQKRIAFLVGPNLFYRWLFISSLWFWCSPVSQSFCSAILSRKPYII